MDKVKDLGKQIIIKQKLYYNHIKKVKILSLIWVWIIEKIKMRIQNDKLKIEKTLVSKNFYDDLSNEEFKLLLRK